MNIKYIVKTNTTLSSESNLYALASIEVMKLEKKQK